MPNPFQPILDAQREHFLSDATKSYHWRIDQLDRMERMLTDNRDALARRCTRISASHLLSNCSRSPCRWA
jgi:aldehyde dehydrogenase (NAD+)